MVCKRRLRHQGDDQGTSMEGRREGAMKRVKEQRKAVCRKAEEQAVRRRDDG